MKVVRLRCGMGAGGDQWDCVSYFAGFWNPRRGGGAFNVRIKWPIFVSETTQKSATFFSSRA